MIEELVVVHKLEHDDFTWARPWRNFQIICEGRSLWVNIGWLVELSPIFRDLDTSYFDDNGKQKKALYIDEVSYTDLLEFFRCIFYCPMRKSLTSANVFIVFRLAKRFQMITVMARCEMFIMSSVKKFDGSRLIEAARELGNDPNASTTMSLIVDRIANLSDKDLSTIEFNDLPGDIVANVFNNHQLKKAQKEKKKKKGCRVCSIM